MDQSSGINIQGFEDKIPRLSGLASRQPRILVAPLDWGLGHATRCIPVIRELMNQGCDVWLAGEGAQEALLRKEFPALTFLTLPGYRVVYGKSDSGFFKHILFQVPQILKAIKQENAWLKKMITEHQIDGVISDNRFGLQHENIPSVFMTHQLLIKTRMGGWMERVVQKRNYSYINKFTECWVPDMENGLSLAGELSHPKKIPQVPVRYTGILSRFKESGEESRKDHLVVLLSGPEPQRSILENIMIRELGHYAATATVVRGLPGTETVIPSSNMIRFYNHLPAEELNQEINSADYVISRSGYSTVMDLVQLKKKSILIPTPGQPEQEWLEKWLQEKKIAISIQQKDFTLAKALQTARNFNYHFPEMDNGTALSSVIAEFIKSVNN